jgi:hypothetical protein
MNLRYETTLIWRTLTRLALWLAILTFTSPIEALPNRPIPYTLDDYATASVVPGQSNAPLDQQSDTTSTDEHSNTNSQAAAATGDTPSAEAADADASFNAPCLHSDSSTNTQATDSKGVLCDKPLESQRRLGLRFGRRMRTRNSMLGDFDGVMVDYGLGNFIVDGIAGFPAASGNDVINPQKQLFGFSAASGKFAKGWDMSGYYMDLSTIGQNNNRSALGGTLRYSHSDRSLLISADYDLLKHTLSRVMVSSAWKLLPTSTLSTTFDIQQSYLPTPQKNYLQQTIAMTDGWKWGLPLDRIDLLSTDASTDVAAFSLSLSHALSHNIKLDSDIAILNVFKEEDSSNLASSLSKCNEYYFYLKLTGKSLLLPGDSSTFTLRHNISDTSRLSSSLLDGSYDISHQWHLSPTLKLDYRDDLADHSTQWTATPAVKVEYRLRKRAKINFKAAGEWRKRQDLTDEAYHATYAVSLGYSTDF